MEHHGTQNRPTADGFGLTGVQTRSNAVSRSISAENPTGDKGNGGRATTGTGASAARDLGVGWKVSPSVKIDAGETLELADITDSGTILSMWFGGYVGRDIILRIFWDEQEVPSVEVPLSDFFALPWVTSQHGRVSGPLTTINSLPVAVNPNRGLNCYWHMSFNRRCRVTAENRSYDSVRTLYYQINYELTEIDPEVLYFHAQFREVNPLGHKEPYTILDGVCGAGNYVGTSMGWGINNSGWWGEGEIKFYLDGDLEFPTICGTGVEDYFGGAYNWEVDGEYVEYSTPYLGMHVCNRPDGLYNSQQRHSMYRWHLNDPIRFERDLKVTIQALGWRPLDRTDGARRYYPGRHHISSVAYWYQSLPSCSFPTLPSRDEIEIV